MFKHTGGYVLLAVLLNWLIIRRERRNRWLLFAGAAAVIAETITVWRLRSRAAPGRTDVSAARFGPLHQ